MPFLYSSLKNPIFVAHKFYFMGISNFDIFKSEMPLPLEGARRREAFDR